MAKMAFEATIDAIEKGYSWPGTQMHRYVVPADDLKKYGLQRKKGSDATHYAIWMISVGELGGQLTNFFGHRLLDAAKAAYEWRMQNGGTQPQAGG